MPGKKWRAKLIRPKQTIKLSAFKGWERAAKDLEAWLEKDLVQAMVYGGFGIQGIAQTAFYKWITSPDGLSQLGIEPSEPPKLLAAYEKTIKVTRSGRVIKIKFGDLAKLKLATPHPASGTGNLNVESWLEWAIEDKKVESGFVPREKLPRGGIQKRIRLQGAPGGLMLPKGRFGSKGSWQFPKRYADFEEKWFKRNVVKIREAVQRKALFFLKKNLK